MEDYQFKRVNQENLRDLLPVFKNAFKRDISLNDLERKMNTFHSPVSFLGMIGYYKNEFPCSYYGVYPLHASIGGKKELISQSGDTMTHSEHIGRGLFYESAKITYNLSKENGVKGVFGFPSKTSYPGFKKKLNWIFTGHIIRYILLVPTLPFSLLTHKFSFLKVVYMIWVNFILLFYKKGNDFPGSIISNGQDGVLRDDAFWKYKKGAGEIQTIKIGNKNVIIKFNGRLSIGDIEISGEDDFTSIIRRLKILAFLTFNTHIVFFVSPDTLLDRKLSNVAVASKALPIGFANFTEETDLTGMKFTYFDFDTF